MYNPWAEGENCGREAEIEDMTEKIEAVKEKSLFFLSRPVFFSVPCLSMLTVA